MVAHQHGEAGRKAAARGEHRNPVVQIPVGVIGEMDGDVCRRLTRDRGLHAIGLIPQHDFECCEAGGSRRLDRANDERRAENGLEELRLAREIPKSIVVASGEHERLSDSPFRGPSPCTHEGLT
jgi:hypothetical protein